MFEGLLQPTHLLIIAVVAIVVFGPKNLPVLGKTVGKTIKSIRDGMEGLDDDEDEPVEVRSTENN